MNKYTYDELMDKTIKELNKILEKVQDELYEKRKAKSLLVTQIIGTQGMINEE